MSRDPVQGHASLLPVSTGVHHCGVELSPSGHVGTEGRVRSVIIHPCIHPTCTLCTGHPQTLLNELLWRSLWTGKADS